MKSYPMPVQFDGAKFAARYSLNSLKDFWSDGQFIYVPDNLPDDPPIFEAPNAPGPTLVSKVQALTVAQNLKDVLLELAKGR